jgi:hypothetical protein
MSKELAVKTSDNIARNFVLGLETLFFLLKFYTFDFELFQFLCTRERAGTHVVVTLLHIELV